MDRTIYGLKLDAFLELLRETNCRPFEVVGLIQFMTDRKEFKRCVNKLIRKTRGKDSIFDKMIVFGTYRNEIYNKIILIKYE